MINNPANYEHVWYFGAACFTIAAVLALAWAVIPLARNISNKQP